MARVVKVKQSRRLAKVAPKILELASDQALAERIRSALLAADALIKQARDIGLKVTFEPQAMAYIGHGGHDAFVKGFTISRPL